MELMYMSPNFNNAALVHAYGDWIIHEASEGRIPYYINIMFEPLHRPGSSVMSQMSDAVYASKGSFYGKLCSRFDKHPGRKGRNRFLPHAFLFFDLPVFKYQKRQPLRDVIINGGVHVNGVMMIPSESRMRDEFAEHIGEKRALYAQNGIKRIHVQPVTHGVHRVTDYAMKTLKEGRVDWDTAIILPRSYAELRSDRLRIDPHARAIKDIQAASNVSNETAEHIHHSSITK
jgi:hypothetical protein